MSTLKLGPTGSDVGLGEPEVLRPLQASGLRTGEDGAACSWAWGGQRCGRGVLEDQEFSFGIVGLGLSGR